MKTIAIIGGTGKLGTGLAVRWAIAGEDVIIGSRSLEKAEKTAEILSEKYRIELRGLRNEDVARLADVIVLTIPYEAIHDTMNMISSKIRGDAKIISPIVSPNPSKGNSSAELVKKLAPIGVQVAAAFQTLPYKPLPEIDKEIVADILVFGEEIAKEEAIRLAHEIPGVRAIDAGGLEDSWIVEAMTHLIISLNKKYRRKAMTIKLIGL